MQIHELSSPRRTDEGLGDLAKAAGTALGQAVSPTQNTPTTSAGILDPAQKLAAVKKEPAMVKLAGQYAQEWMAKQPAPVQAQQQAPAQAQPAPAPGETPEQKRVRLQKAAQQNIDKTAVPAPVKTAAATPADIRQSKQAQAAQTAQSQMAPFNKLPADQAATQAANIRKAKQAQAAAAAQSQMSAVKEDTAVTTPGTYNKKTGAAELGGKSMTALSDLPPHIQQQIQAKQQASAKSTGTAMPMKPYQVPGAGTNPTPATSVVPTTATPPSAATDYLKKFLAFANEKIAMRDPSTYQMIGLTAVEQSKMKPLLDTAKQQVIAAQAKGDPAGTEQAVKNYILTAMAGAQLAASENAIKAPKAPAYGSNAQSANQAATTQGTPAQTDGQVTPAQIAGLIATAGLDQPKLSAMGSKLQQLSGNRAVSSTGDSGVDQLLRSMGYTIS